jgi:signal peptidase I
LSAANAAAAQPARNEFVDTVRTVGWGLLIALALRIFVFQPYTIPSSSMEPGLRTGDYVIVSKFSYGWSRASVPFDPPLPAGRLLGRSPHRGDVIVFRLPRDAQVVYVKRLIGLPGDRVQVSAGQVFVNGKAIPQHPLGFTEDPEAPGRRVLRVAEPRTDGRTYVTYVGPPGGEADNTGVYVVPAGHFFFMGDNRDNSLDSRWPPAEGGVGYVPAENLIGKVDVVMMSWRPGASVLKPWTWLNLRPSRFLHPVT